MHSHSQRSLREVRLINNAWATNQKVCNQSKRCWNETALAKTSHGVSEKNVAAKLQNKWEQVKEREDGYICMAAEEQGGDIGTWWLAECLSGS